MDVELMNMCMIYNAKTNEVVVLDKILKEGWEGLTFPGGHVEEEESFIDSVIREIKEETDLDIKNPRIKGVIQWIEQGEHKRRSVGILYYTEEFSGLLVEKNREGDLSWMDWEDFKKAENLSKSMDLCNDIYEGKMKEVLLYFIDGEYQYKDCFY
ncbi:MAG: NUDIX domain-containing protein [Gallicola sp.]|nr:NUDIX domain-containing protein [Gallicola sp.]